MDIQYTSCLKQNTQLRDSTIFGDMCVFIIIGYLPIKYLRKIIRNIIRGALNEKQS